jgi:hypothetical protein
MRATYYAFLWLSIGLAAGAIIERNFDTPKAGTGPAKIIDWRPADRYEMSVGVDGSVWRLDRATGTIHFVRGDLSFDVPEYRTGD